VETKVIEKSVPIQPRPSPIKLSNITWRVINESNLKEFLQSFKDTKPVFFAISVKDYETLAINMSEISRYIQQQKAIIVYYENSLSPKKESANETK
jgi:hypothetical protein